MLRELPPSGGVTFEVEIQSGLCGTARTAGTFGKLKIIALPLSHALRFVSFPLPL